MQIVSEKLNKAMKCRNEHFNGYIRNGRHYTPLAIKSLPKQYCYLEQPGRPSRIPPCLSPGAAAPGWESGGAVTWAADRSPPPARRSTASGCARPPPPRRPLTLVAEHYLAQPLQVSRLNWYERSRNTLSQLGHMRSKTILTFYTR